MSNTAGLLTILLLAPRYRQPVRHHSDRQCCGDQDQSARAKSYVSQVPRIDSRLRRLVSLTKDAWSTGVNFDLSHRYGETCLPPWAAACCGIRAVASTTPLYHLLVQELAFGDFFIGNSPVADALDASASEPRYQCQLASTPLNVVPSLLRGLAVCHLLHRAVRAVTAIAFLIAKVLATLSNPPDATVTSRLRKKPDAFRVRTARIPRRPSAAPTLIPLS